MAESDPARRPELSDAASTETEPSGASTDWDRRARFVRILFLWISLALLFGVVWTFLGPVR